MNKNEIIGFLNSFTKSGAPVSDLSRVKGLLEKLDNPQKALRFIHIAGTNGKGSVAAMFYNTLLCAGIRAGQFISPYIIEYTDRIQFCGRNITYDELSPLCEQVKAAVDDDENSNNFSQFEITMAMAFLFYKQQKAEVVVLETGLGGLLDSTNVIDPPLLCVITSISHDHMGILGNTLFDIARQKAGIIKRGTPTVLAANNQKEVVDAVSAAAREKFSRLIIPNLNELVHTSDGIRGESFMYKGVEYKTSMPGSHQIINALCVIEGFKLLKDRFSVNREDIQQGIANSVIPGRTEVISSSPLVILDGCHNDGGIKALADVLNSENLCPTAVVGMLKDKNADKALLPLIGTVKKFITTDGFHPNAYDKAELANIILSLGGNAEIGSDPVCEYQKAKDGEYGDAVIFGSLYLVSEIKNA